MLKYSKFKYNNTRNFYLQHMRKNVFESNDNKHNEGNNKMVANDYICPFCEKYFENPFYYGGHVTLHRNEPNYKEIIDNARKTRNAKRNNID